MVAHMCEYTKKHRIVYFEWMTRIVSELYLHKAVFFKKP